MSFASRSPADPAARVLVLMYHAVPGQASGGLPARADPHYSVELGRFRAQLDLMLRRGKRPTSVRDLLGSRAQGRAVDDAVAVTFDDGHLSNFDAFAEIASRGGTADLFVNPSTVGQRGFLSWTQLRELARAGASIQSHSEHHVFLDELPTASVRREMETSSRHIADEIGTRPSLFAPPNGRLPGGGVQLALEAGYQAVCSSRVGLWLPGSGPEVPRVAVLASTSEHQLRGWIRQDRMTVWTGVTRAAVLRGGKRMLGNHRYQRWRERLLRLQGGQQP